MCLDIDECEQNPCGVNFICRNSVGSFTCEQIDRCSTQPCDSGYQCQNAVSQLGYVCIDKDECEGNPCGQGYVCNNTPGTFECNDINECLQVG